MQLRKLVMILAVSLAESLFNPNSHGRNEADSQALRWKQARGHDSDTRGNHSNFAAQTAISRSQRNKRSASFIPA